MRSKLALFTVFAVPAAVPLAIAAESPVSEPAARNEAAAVSAQAAFDDLVERSQFAEAIEWGERVVKQAAEKGDADELGAAHAQLGLAQHKTGDFANAIANYDIAVRMMEVDSGFENAALADAQLGLSRAQADAGVFSEAAKSYKKAANLIRATHGVRSLEQVNAITELSEVYYQLGKYSKADSLQKNYVKLMKKAHPEEPMAVVPALYSRADMLMRIGELRKASENYRRIARIVEKSEGEDSLELLPALYNLSVVHTTQELATRKDLYDGAHKYVSGTKRSKARIVGSDTDQRVGNEIVGGLSTFNAVRETADNKVNHLAMAYRSLKRAINVAENNPDASEIEVADTHIAMGDFLTLMTRDRVSAASSYSAAWGHLVSEGLQDERDNRFSRPVPLNDVPVIWEPAMRSLMSREMREGDAQGSVEVSYDVNDEGRSENVRIVSSDPEGFRDRLVASHIKRMVFRPKFTEDGPVVTKNNRFRISYSYTPEE